jgi:hypothetical protein
MVSCRGEAIPRSSERTPRSPSLHVTLTVRGAGMGHGGVFTIANKRFTFRHLDPFTHVTCWLVPVGLLLCMRSRDMRPRVVHSREPRARNWHKRFVDAKLRPKWIQLIIPACSWQQCVKAWSVIQNWLLPIFQIIRHSKNLGESNHLKFD